ncbi:hypothetical protein VOI54_03970 [Tamlana sp. 2201CG12-4]|uniref:hypothetical protein n=1 Tax=Tamlana sp. 2201CG12-4 TaxID=3112582 RepID=UPI002DBFC029|nr:hypothetical protein [Tamlana sp. 2201CG12-4]MEC3906160.1 hypothetical protein [Tamlana sp. 2201CG12-4]
MDDINTIYYNDFGIAFQWKRCAARDLSKVQLIFRNTGLFLSKEELVRFCKNIKAAFNNPDAYFCKQDSNYKTVLLQAPNTQTSFVMTLEELKNISDLVEGTVFQLGLDTLLEKQKVDYN